MKIKYGDINKLYNKTLLDDQINHWKLEYISLVSIMKQQDKKGLLNQKDYDYYDGLLSTIDEFIGALKVIKKEIK